MKAPDVKGAGGVRAGQGHKILLSVQDPRLHAELQTALEAAGFRWESIPLGPDAFGPILNQRPPAVILEVPEGHPSQGELLDRVGRSQATRSVPMLVFSRDLRIPFRTQGIYQFFHDYTAIPACIDAVRDALTRRTGFDAAAPLLSVEQFRKLEDAVHLKTGITLKRERLKRLEGSIRDGMRDLGIRSADEFLEKLRLMDIAEPEWQALLPSLTVEETSFFRTADHFRALEEVAIPAILKRKRPGDSIRVWCAGCSTGEEAYSLAMSVRERVPDPIAYPVQVIATDINPAVLAVARQAAYTEKQVRKAPEKMRRKYFVKLGDAWYPDRSIRRSVIFKDFNLQSPSSAFRRLFPFPIDVIFCRNVVIYFRKVTIQRLVESFHSILADQGYLFLGYSETLYKFRHRFETLFWRDTFFYQKHSGVDVETRQRDQREDVVSRPEHRPEPRPEPAPAGNDGDGGPEVAGELEADGYTLLAAGDALGAERAFARAAEDDLDSLVGRAYACIRDGRFDEARAIGTTVRDRADTRPEGYYIAGLVSQSKGDSARARTEYEKALFLDARFYPAHVQLAELLAAEEQVEAAIRGFRNALESLPGSRTPYLVTLEGIVPSGRVPQILSEVIQSMEEARR